MTLELDATPEDLQIRLPETEEHWQLLDQELVRLERDASDPELLQEIFRAAHTLKGSSVAIKHHRMAELTHALENALDDLRNGVLSVSSRLVDVLLEALDALRILRDEVITREGNSDLDVAAITERLHAVQSGDGAEAVGDERAAEHSDRVPNDGDRRTIDLGSEARGKTEREQLKMAAAKLNRTSKTVRIDVERLDNLMNLAGELVIDKMRLQQVSAELNTLHSGKPAVAGLDQAALHVGRITDELQEEVMRSRMQPIERVFNKLPRIVRDLARNMQKSVEFVIEGKEIELDRSVIEEIVDLLINIIRNSVDHGIESPEARAAAGKPAEGAVHLSARHEENKIVIAVSDDGGGIDPERLRRKALETGQLTEEVAARLTYEEAVELVFRSGVSTATEVTDVSGRGVGMDIVRTNIEKLNGNVSVKSEFGRGTVVEIRLPLTLAIVRALLIKLREDTFAIPLTSVMESLGRRPEEIFTAHGREMIRLRDDVLPLIRLGAFFAVGENGADHDADAPATSNENGSTNGHTRTSIPVVAVKVGGRRSSLAVDKLLGEQEVVTKALGGFI